ncbi:hypothetical protein Leryth_011343 [Lithospermum erythrorhizon]|nr:hypothetical protein Leryth_011343 [Lithospermum erythrorhizon]
MAVSFRYWEECVDTKDLETMWTDPDVVVEWLNAGETRGSKVHLSRDPDGNPYLTQTEMKAVAGIIVRRHFHSQIDSDMLCALATLESDRQPLTTRYNKKTKETTIGVMQISSKTAEWLVRDHGYRNYDISRDPEYLFKPFVNVYLGAAYLKWLSTFGNKERSEEFMVRAFKRGTKKATHKSTLPYWKQYLSVKESLPARKFVQPGPCRAIQGSGHATEKKVKFCKTNFPSVHSAMMQDSRVLSIQPGTPELQNRIWKRCGIIRQFCRLSGTKAEGVEKAEASLVLNMMIMKGGSIYIGKELKGKTPQFIVQAYLGGPQNATEENGPQWLKFEEALSLYDPKKDEGSCCIL